MSEVPLYRLRGQSIMVKRGRKRLPEFVQNDMLADRVGGTRLSTLINALDAVDAGLEPELLDDPKGVAISLLILTRKDEPGVG